MTTSFAQPGLAFFDEAEMPLTPKGYCDDFFGERFFFGDKAAEMPLTPKGYCDSNGLNHFDKTTSIRQKCP